MIYLQPKNYLSPGPFHFGKYIAERNWKGEKGLETGMNVQGMIIQTKVLSLEIETTEEIQIHEWSREDVGNDWSITLLIQELEGTKWNY